ncbi:MAG: folate-binding protein [Cyanobacteria bacterium J06598_3]
MSALITPEQILGAGPVVFDRSHWGQIRLTGADRVRFLHNQTTNNIEQLKAGEGCYTVFVTSTGRTIDLASVYAFEESLLLSVSPEMAKPLYDWMDRYIFFSDKVTLSDESEQTFWLTVVGEGADDVVRSLGVASLIGQPTFTHQSVELAGGETIEIAAGSDLAIAGYTLWGDESLKSQVLTTILESDAAAGSAEQWELLRVQQGRPMPNHELTDDDNPLEAGLWQSVSFEKGCYIGQETIARLNTYQGVKKRLWGVTLPQRVPLGTALLLDGKKVGKVTSVVSAASGALGLAYIRTKSGGAGLELAVEETAEGALDAPAPAQAEPLPFVTHEYYASADK